jgi:hypothetical protein
MVNGVVKEGTYTGLTHTWAMRHAEWTGNKEHARQAVDSFVRVDIAQSVFREVRSNGEPLHARAHRAVTGVSFTSVISAACLCLRV